MKAKLSPKAIHICNSHQPTLDQKLSISVSVPTHGRQKRKHDCTTWYIKNWADSDKLKGFGSNQALGFGDR
jgi:hypothetical protein